MAIDRDTVVKIAHLARLHLTDPEIEKYRAQLDAVLNHIDRLRELPVDGIEPFLHSGDLVNVSRADGPRPSLPTDVALANAPAKNGPYFVVPRILEQ